MPRFVCALMATILLCACGRESRTGDVDTPASERSKVKIIASDFRFLVRPDTIPEGNVETTLVNRGKEPHQAGYYLLNEGVPYDEFISSIARDDSLIPQLASGGRLGHMRSLSGGEVGVRPADDLTAGTYAVLCSIRDPKTGKNHYELGMVARLTVE